MYAGKGSFVVVWGPQPQLQSLLQLLRPHQPHRLPPLPPLRALLQPLYVRLAGKSALMALQ
jgi:hypothetical protein